MLITTYGVNHSFFADDAEENGLSAFRFHTQAPHMDKVSTVWCEDRLCFRTLLSYWNRDAYRNWHYSEVE